MEAVTVKEMISSPMRIASSEAHTANGNGNGNGNGSSSAIRKKPLGEASKRARYPQAVHRSPLGHAKHRS